METSSSQMGADGKMGADGRKDVMELSGKKVIAIGERDGVQGTSIGNCARSAGATVVLEMTHCFV